MKYIENNISSEKCFYSKKNIFLVEKSKIHLFIHAILYMLLGYSLSNENNLTSTFTAIIIIAYFIISKPTEHFFFFIGFAPFEYAATINGTSIYFLFLFISVAKMIISKKNIKFKLSVIISLTLLICIEFLNEFGNISNGNFLIIISIICYFVFFVLLSDKNILNVKRIIQNICISYIIVIFTIIKEYGSFIHYLNMIRKSDQVIRFGSDTLSVGGAMGLPLYSAIIISMLISYYIARPNLKLNNKILIIFMCSISFLFGILTISRSFILTMIAWLLFLTLSIFDKYWKKILKILFLIFIMAIIVYVLKADAINKLINDFLFRANNDSGLGIRGLIWKSCFDYLNDHPFGYLLGFGIKNYIEIGKQNNLLFSALAHNLYIDILMSIGLIGYLCLFYLIYIFKLKLKKMINNDVKLISYIPLAVFLVFGLTALSLYNFKTWIYILMLIIFAYANFEQVQYEQKGGFIND